MTSIAVEFPGNPESVRQAGEWMRHQIESAVNDADINIGIVAVTSYRYWEGESGTAFNNIANDLSAACRELNEFAGTVAEKFHVYAGEMQRVQERLAGYVDHAIASGLPVDGVRVYRPEWVGNVPQGASDAGWDQWRELRKQQREYDRVEEDCLKRKAEIIGWVAENLLPIVGALPRPTLGQQVYEKLATVVGLGTEIGGEYLDNAFANSIDRLNTNAENWRHAAAEIERRSTASGSPATQQRLRDLIQENLPEHLRSAAGGASSLSDVTRGLRQIANRVLGPGADIALAVWELSDGAEPVDLGVGIAGGAAGSAAAIALGVTPVGWGVIAIAGAGVVGGEIASGIWGATPESWREGIYHWVDDGIVIGGDVIEDIGDWFYDTSEAIGGHFR